MRLIPSFTIENHNFYYSNKTDALQYNSRTIESIGSNRSNLLQSSRPSETCRDCLPIQYRSSHVQSSAAQLGYDPYQSHQSYSLMMIQSKNMIHLPVQNFVYFFISLPFGILSFFVLLWQTSVFHRWTFWGTKGSLLISKVSECLSKTSFVL